MQLTFLDLNYVPQGYVQNGAVQVQAKTETHNMIKVTKYAIKSDEGKVTGQFKMSPISSI